MTRSAVVLWMVSAVSGIAAVARADAAAAEAPQPAPKSEPEPPPVATEAPMAGVRPTFGLVGSVDHGTLPSTALGVTVRVGLAWEWFRLHAYALVLPEREYATGMVGSTFAGANLSLVAAGVEGCLLFAPAPLFACAAAEADHVWGRGYGVDESPEGSATWPAFTAAAGVALPLAGPLSFEIGGGPIVPLRRERFGLDGVGEVNQPAAVGLRASVGLSALF